MTAPPEIFEITLAHSPDSDDVAMWWPLGTDVPPPSIDTGPFRFRALAAEIQTLNRRAIEHADLHATAISAFTYPSVAHAYRITACAASFGEGYGPKVVVPAASDIGCDACLRARPRRVAIPGRNTTAFLALTILLDGRFEPVEVPFDRVIDTVAQGRADAALLIHEAQLTFASHALRQIADLGEWWTRTQGLPLPLGLNVIRRDLDRTLFPGACEHLARILQASVRHARTNQAHTRSHLRARAHHRPEWTDDALLDRYLDMYVNDMTEDMGPRGRDALARLYRQAAARSLCPADVPLDIL